MKKLLHVAIDGPVGAGKGTVANLLAQRLGITYIYTGGMYRALAYSCKKHGVDLNDEQAVDIHLQKIHLEVKSPTTPGKLCRILVDGVDVTEVITSVDIARGGSIVSTYLKVRQQMVKMQQDMAQNTSVVMEGRDIGLRVLPHADLKIYLQASLKERARRRWLQHGRADGLTFEEELAETRERDVRDMGRSVDPLQKLPDAWELDTTRLKPEAVVEKILKELGRRQLI